MRKLKVTELNRISVAEFKKSDKYPLVVILDNVRSQHNVGAVFRTADAFRIQGICLCGITACPPKSDIHKTALGAEDSVEWTYYEDTIDAVNHLHEEGYEVWAVEQVSGSIMLQNFDLKPAKPYAIIMGNEVQGVRQDVVDLCDGCLEIPQFGTKHSLNVSVTTGIVMWDFMKKFMETCKK